MLTKDSNKEFLSNGFHHLCSRIPETRNNTTIVKTNYHFLNTF